MQQQKPRFLTSHEKQKILLEYNQTKPQKETMIPNT